MVVLEEHDARFELNLRATRSERLIVIWSESRSTSEAWVLDAAAPESTPRSVGGRRHGVVYHVEHAPSSAGDRMLVVTNDGAVEFRLMTAPVSLDADLDASAWVEARPEHPDERLYRADAFADGVVLSYRSGGAHRLRIVRHDDLAGEGRVLSSRYDGGLSRPLPERAVRRAHRDRRRRELPAAAGLVDGRPRAPGSASTCTAVRRRASTRTPTPWSGVPSRRRTAPRCRRCSYDATTRRSTAPPPA